MLDFFVNVGKSFLGAIGTQIVGNVAGEVVGNMVGAVAEKVAGPEAGHKAYAQAKNLTRMITIQQITPDEFNGAAGWVVDQTFDGEMPSDIHMP